MSNQVSTINQLYINIKRTDTIYTIPILSSVRRVLVLKTEIERDILEIIECEFNNLKGVNYE